MKKKNSSIKSATDWARVDAMQDEDIDFSDSPELTPEMFAKGVLRYGLKPVTKKDLITLRVDEDVLTWFRAQGRGYQTQINALLRAYMEAKKQSSTKSIPKRKSLTTKKSNPNKKPAKAGLVLSRK